ncbi:MAG: FHA domain-containing protein [Bradymonadales bacterium]|nr:MAG: FHA domain-containing protein [Bradymonadales bacterium]
MTGPSRKSLTDSLFETNYQSKVAAELWLNIGGKEYRLVGKKIKIGRAVDNDIVLEHKSCSRYHAMIRVENNRVILEDLKSRNGVRVNGTPIVRVELQENAEIQVGDLPGLFYQRQKATQKTNREVTAAGILSPDISVAAGQLERLGLSERFQALPKALRLSLIALVPLFMFGVLILSQNNSSMGTQAVESSTPLFSLTESDIIQAVVPRTEFENCRVEEDLGNFRRARSCLEALPLTEEVFMTLRRVIERQHNLSMQRYKEGEMALKNKYYDLAILKLQEVLLIADESSEFLSKIPRMIEEAKEGKRLL